MKRGKRRSWYGRRWASLALLTLALAACNDGAQEWFQVRNDSPDQVFVIVTTDYGRNLYPVQPRSTVALGHFNSQDGDIEVLGLTCKLLATIGAPETQNTIFDPKANAWLGGYEITIPRVGTPTVASASLPEVDASLPPVRGVVLDPTETDPSVCPPVTVPGAVPQGDIRLPELGAVAR